MWGRYKYIERAGTCSEYLWKDKQIWSILVIGGSYVLESRYEHYIFHQPIHT